MNVDKRDRTSEFESLKFERKKKNERNIKDVDQQKEKCISNQNFWYICKRNNKEEVSILILNKNNKKEI